MSSGTEIRTASGPAIHAGPQPGADEDAALWARLVSADSLEQFCRSWLAVQCRQLPDTIGGLLVLGSADRGPFKPVAVWPDVQRNLKHLAPAAERALVEPRASSVCASCPAGAGACSDPFAILAWPTPSGAVLGSAAGCRASSRSHPPGSAEAGRAACFHAGVQRADGIACIRSGGRLIAGGSGSKLLATTGSRREAVRGS